MHNLISFFCPILILTNILWLCTSIYTLGGIEEAVYSLLPYIPIQIFQGFAVIYVYFNTVWFLPLARSLQIVPPPLPCRNSLTKNDLWVIVTGPKGGTVLGARATLDIGSACGLRVGIGFRETSDWPPCQESLPPYESDILMAIANLQTWPQYVKDYQQVRCVVITRHPFARFQSLFQYAYDGGELHLTEASRKLKSLSIEQGLEWMLTSIGNQTMKQSHDYLMMSLDHPNCIQIKFEDFSKNFDESARKWLIEGWGIITNNNKNVINELLKIISRHDLSRLSEEQRKANHHVSGSRVDKQSQHILRKAILGNYKLLQWLNEQAVELGYDVIES
jgi:hypothetical protein